MAALSGTKSHIRYRPYIDGLRGIAIIAVVLNHARLALTGGFIGVDVFFVISGFLITSIIVRDLRDGTFTLLGFWERRIRRIFPALMVVMVACCIAAYVLILYPPDFHHFGATVLAQSVFASNILFTLTDNYFDQSSRFSPLLHTWSLSVEEQFYVLFPLLVLLGGWLTRRLSARTRVWLSLQNKKALLAGMIALTVASFMVNVWCVDLRPGTAFIVPFLPQSIFFQSTYATAGFYLLFARAWELGIGVLAALFSFEITSAVFAEIISLAGIVAIFASALLFNDATPYPGVAALMPTVGACAVIVGNEHHVTRTGRYLAYPLLVWVGLISYSLYLWHWPIFVFASLAAPALLGPLAMLGLMALSVVIAWLSYAYVETPFRSKMFMRSRTAVFASGFCALVLLASVGSVIEKRATVASMHNIPHAASETLQFLADVDRDQATSTCFQVAGVQTYGELCGIGDKQTSKPQFVVWGDSHATALSPLFDNLSQLAGMQGVVFGAAGCAPVSGAWTVRNIDSCQDQNNRALHYITDADIKVVFLVARWGLYLTGGPDGSHAALLTDSRAASHSGRDAQAALERHLIPMVRQLSNEGRTVYVVRQVPEQFDYDPRTAFYRAVHTGETLQAADGVSVQASASYQLLANAVLDKLATIPHVKVLDPTSLLCNESLCSPWRDTVLLYRDENHLSEAGAMNLSPLFSPLFRVMHAQK